MKNLKEIKKILEISTKNKINSKTNLEDLNWDSLAMINLITFANKKFKKRIVGNDISSLSTIQDLDNFILKLKKKK
tara:strand:+ start:2203 stop:2430 length:228 start_codon:yes stop_codon:yes gene_type:complete